MDMAMSMSGQNAAVMKTPAAGGGGVAHPGTFWDADCEVSCWAEDDAGGSSDLTITTGITAWDNRGTLGGFWKQATAAKRPTLTTDPYSGRKAVQFAQALFMALRNEADDADLTVGDVWGSEEGFALVVWRGDVDPISFFRHIFGDTYGPAQYLAWTSSGGGNSLRAQVYDASGTTGVDYAAVKDTTYIIALRIDGGQTPAPLSLDINGTEEDSTDMAAETLNAAFLAAGLTLGADATSAQGKLMGVVFAKTIPADLATRFAGTLAFFAEA